MPIKNRLSDLHAEITEWRHDLHAHPELLYDTHRTASVVAARLREFGCDEVVEGIGRTGVVGVIKGRQDSAGRAIGLRADMDALPIFEDTDLEYSSGTPGRMHACGHDGHTAMLLGAAKYLAETRNFNGNVIVVFQPAEEGGAGGEAMIRDGLIERFGIQEIYGMHNMPGLPLGHFQIRPGVFYAAVDTFEIVVQGQGGHAARPNKTVDATLVAAAIVMALQSIVARNTDPQTTAVVSVTSVRTESDAYNVIPSHATLRGTVRTYEPDNRSLIEQRIRALASLTAQAYDAEAAIEWHAGGYPSLVNHERETALMADVAEVVAGAVDREAPRTTGGEDFAFMLEACKGAYIQVGNGDTAQLHHPAYDFNDELIPIGCSFWAELAESRLPVA